MCSNERSSDRPRFRQIRSLATCSHFGAKLGGASIAIEALDHRRAGCMIKVQVPPSKKPSTAGVILIVDDDAGTRTALRRALEWDGYAVHTAASPDEGLKVL